MPLLPSIPLFGKELGLDQCCIKQRPMKEEAPPNIRILSSPREMCFLNLRFLRRQNWVEATDLKPNLDWEARKRKLFSWAWKLIFFLCGEKKKKKTYELLLLQFLFTLKTNHAQYLQHVNCTPNRSTLLSVSGPMGEKIHHRYQPFLERLDSFELDSSKGSVILAEIFLLCS